MDPGSAPSRGDTSRADVWTAFTPATRAWFTRTFGEPTTAQQQAWSSISAGSDTLVVAPTGSGKTLAAFLWAIDRLHRPGPATAPAPAALPPTSAIPATPAPGNPAPATRAIRDAATPTTAPPATPGAASSALAAPATQGAATPTTAPPAAAAPAAPAASGRSACRILYISPLKALAVDVERNLRVPLAGIAAQARSAGHAVPDVRVFVRSGDTPAAERRTFARHPADILITTPESLFLMLTSSAREALRGIETVIVDEIHVLAGNKRGAHLAVSLARLDALTGRRPQRIGLSATVRPLDVVSAFLGGDQPVRVIAPDPVKEWDLAVQVPVADLSDLERADSTREGPARSVASADPARRHSLWPHVADRILDLLVHHRCTLVFVNSRRVAERLTTRLNDLWADRLEAGIASPPAAWADSPVVAAAHHGSMSKESRALLEADLKAGRLPAVVATSSLELGIDMGAIDLVIQVGSPPSVSSALQRVGRAGHQVGASSRGVFLPTHAADLIQASVIAEQMQRARLEAISIPRNPLDVLAQQIVAMCADDDWPVPQLLELLRRTAPFAHLTRGVLDSVLDMLAGRYPGQEFASLRARIVWNRVTDTLSGRRGSRHLAVTSGGTIPDRGLFAVILAGSTGTGRRVGELDEEMVYESRVGDVFTLGSSAWRIEEITQDRVLVSPAPGAPARPPFWKGDSLGRGSELGATVGTFVRELADAPEHAARERLTRIGLDAWAADNLLAHLHAQAAATQIVPDDRQLVLERFRDDLGDWRIVLHSPYGAQVHAPWALALAARLEEGFGLDAAIMHGDDGIVLRLPEADLDEPQLDGWWDRLTQALLVPPEAVTDLVSTQVFGSALFASRFRECAARSLLLPRRDPARRQPLWQQRQRAHHLLQIASGYPHFPVVLETVRECLQDVYDVPGLRRLLERLATGEVRLATVQTAAPSPFARALLLGYVAHFLYDTDTPADRRAAALALDPGLLAELLGGEDSADRELLDPALIRDLEADLQHLSEHRQARDIDDLPDLLRDLGPCSAAEIAARTRATQVPDRYAAHSTDHVADHQGTGRSVDHGADRRVAHGSAPGADHGPDPGADERTAQAADHQAEVDKGLVRLAAAGRVIAVRIGGELRWAAAEDAGRLHAALGVDLPPDLPEAVRDCGDDPVAALIGRYAATHGPFTIAEVARRFGLGPAIVTATITSLVASGRLVANRLRPEPLQPAPADEAPRTGSAPTAITQSSVRDRLDVEANDDADPVRREALREEPTRPGEQAREADSAGGVERFRDHEGLGPDFCDPDVLRRLRRRSLQALRAELAPVSTDAYVRFLARWHGLPEQLRGADGLLDAIDMLAGARVPAAALESFILPARVRGYSPALLDDALARGDVWWQAHGRLPGGDMWVSLHPGATAALTLAAGRVPPDRLPDSQAHHAVREILGDGGAYSLNALARRMPQEVDAPGLELALWDLVHAGVVTSDSFGAIRHSLAGASRPPRRPAVRRHRRRPGIGSLGAWPQLPSPSSRPARSSSSSPAGSSAGSSATVGVAGPAGWPSAPHGSRSGPASSAAIGTWRLLPTPSTDPTTLAVTSAELLLARQGVAAHAGAIAEGFEGGFASIYRVLSRAEESGRVRRGYLAEGLGATQFATREAMEALRSAPRGDTLVLAATDPAQPFGTVLPWPSIPGSADPPRDPDRDPTPHLEGLPDRDDDGVSSSQAAASSSSAAVASASAGHRPGRKAGALVVLHDGQLVLYVERGGHRLLTWSREADALRPAAQALAAANRRAQIPHVTVRLIDGASALSSSHPVAQILRDAGFTMTPQGLRLRG